LSWSRKAEIGKLILPWLRCSAIVLPFLNIVFFRCVFCVPRSCPAGLVLAVVYVSSSGAPGSLLQKMSPESNFQVASQRVAVAQAKVARDLAALRRTESEAGVKGSSKLQGDFGVAAHYGPQTKDGQLEFDRFHRSGSGGPYANELEDPDHEWSRTPRSKAREGDPYFQYGPNARYCPGGNCEPLEEKAGPDMAAERWPHDMYRSIPWMGFDPDASPARNRAINERTGKFTPPPLSRLHQGSINALLRLY